MFQTFTTLIEESFAHIPELDPHVRVSKFDILDPEGRVVLPSVWDEVVRPGWEVSMHMWPIESPMAGIDEANNSTNWASVYDGGCTLGSPADEDYWDPRITRPRDFGKSRDVKKEREEVIVIEPRAGKKKRESLGDRTREREDVRRGYQKEIRATPMKFQEIQWGADETDDETDDEDVCIFNRTADDRHSCNGRPGPVIGLSHEMEWPPAPTKPTKIEVERVQTPSPKPITGARGRESFRQDAGPGSHEVEDSVASLIKYKEGSWLSSALK